MIQIRNDLAGADAALGLVRAEGLTIEATPSGFDERLAQLLHRRTQPLSADEEAIRVAARDMLRNGSYKPTGRGKPASEYLIRAAAKPGYTFPRINGAVDVANYVSLDTVLPVSIWDLDLAATERFAFRLGLEGEVYIFNAGGQEIRLTDLIVGCRIDATTDEGGVPIVNPVKDCLATKTTGATRRVAACVYAPRSVISPDALFDISASFAELLAGCGAAVEVAHGVAQPGETVTV